MKHLMSLLVIGLSFGATAQTFKIQEDTGLADLDICQMNHQRIFNKFTSAADNQAVRLISGINIEAGRATAEFKIKAYKNILADILLKRIVYDELSKQLKAQKFSTYFSKRENYNKEILSTEKMSSKLEIQIPSLLKSISIKTQLNLDDSELNNLSNYLVNKAIKQMALKQTRTLGQNVITSVVAIQGGKLILKSFTMSLGTKILTSAGTAILLDLLTMPLKGGRLPPETLWTDLLQEYPSLIVMPEMMKHGGISDHPWMSHCNAIQRRTKTMEKMLTKALNIDESEFASRVTSIYNLSDELPMSEKKPIFEYKTNLIPRDNTYVRPQVYRPEFQGPLWAHKLK